MTVTAQRPRSEPRRARRRVRSAAPPTVADSAARGKAAHGAALRGGAAIMAADLAPTPRSGLRVQCCGDAHLSNFGVFASADRRLVFDLNDFDETLPAPWEWDVKRLTASLLIAAQSNDDLATMPRPVWGRDELQAGEMWRGGTLPTRRARLRVRQALVRADDRPADGQDGGADG